MAEFKPGVLPPPQRRLWKMLDRTPPDFVLCDHTAQALTKASVVQARACAKDYIDLGALLRAGISLEDALGAAVAVYGAEFNPLLTLKALTYYGVGDLDEVPQEARDSLTAAAAEVDLQRLPTFQPRSRLIPASKGNSHAP